MRQCTMHIVSVEDTATLQLSKAVQATSELELHTNLL